MAKRPSRRDKITAPVAELRASWPVSGDVQRQPAPVKRPYVEVEVTNLAPGQDAKVLQGRRAAALVAR